MKNPFSLFTHYAALLLSLLSLLSLPSPSQAQVVPYTIQAAWTNVITFTNNASSNIFNLGAPIALKNGRGISFQAQILGGAAAVTTNSSLGFAISSDATNYAKLPDQLIWVNFAPNGTTANYSYTNIEPAKLNNAVYARACIFSNGNNAATQVLTVSNVLAVISN